MRKVFSIADEKETRLWNRYMSNTFEPLNKPDSTIQDAGLYQGQVRTLFIFFYLKWSQLSQIEYLYRVVFLESAKKKFYLTKIDTELSKNGLLCRQLLFLSSVKYPLVSVTLIR